VARGRGPHGRLPEATFVARHGYHGPDEGELSGRSWRQDPSPLRGLVAAYADLDGERRPAVVEATRQARRRQAEAALMAALPRSRRAAARALLAMAARYLPLREVGKAAFLQTIDAARLAAWQAGSLLASAAMLATPDDVFHVTLDELLGGAPPPPEVIDERRRARERYLAIELPVSWVGTPDVEAADRRASTVGGDGGRGGSDGLLTGIGVSAGEAEGVARVVTDPVLTDGFEVGDLLVCHMTDPGWASIMFLAAALVVDVGGPMSHAAIVARELGIPCVVNTVDGTHRIRSGQRIRVDGAAGTVEWA
jgi:pyruvate,water dikinase